MNEELEIRAEVKRRRLRAVEIGIVDAVFRLFQERLRVLKSGVDVRELGLPDTVKGVIIADQHGKYVPHSIEVLLDERAYKFLFIEIWPSSNDRDNEGEGQTIRSKLRLKSGGDLLLELECSRTTPIFGRHGYIYGKELRVDRVLAFVEGPWVEQIKEFVGQVFVAEDRQKAEIREEEKQRDLPDLKKRFGI
ncbi:MAG TPA: hypothetical protein VHX20_15720 [Terracidiphilus sp.]|nr:hypothetical protein [Terracidiphilus sp.]